MDDSKEKKYVIPEAEILNFANEDIITLSNNGTAGWTDGEREGWWG